VYSLIRPPSTGFRRIRRCRRRSWWRGERRVRRRERSDLCPGAAGPCCSAPGIRSGPPRCIRRVPCSMNTRTYSLLSSTVAAFRKSTARIPAAWACRNCRQVRPARQVPVVSSGRFPLRGKSGLPADRWRDRGRTAGWSCLPVLGLVRGTFGGGVKDARADRISKGGKYPVHVLSGRGSAGIGCGRRLSGVPGRVQDGSGAVRCSRTQLDLMGHDPKPASRRHVRAAEHG
jgi:hypothetical protein